MAGTDTVFFVEDPGAANYVVGLPAALARRNLTAHLLASGKAGEQLAALGGVFELLADGPVTSTDLARRVTALQPGLVVVGTSENAVSPAFSLVDQMRREGVPSVGVVDGPSNADHRFRGRSGRSLGHAPDWILVADEAVRRRFIELGASPGQVLVGGHPRYDTVLDQGKALVRSDRQALRRRYFDNVGPNDKVVVFLAELSDGVNPHLYRRMPGYSLTGRGDHDGRTEIVLEEILDALAEIIPRPRFVLRLHPKNTRQQYQVWEQEIDSFSAGGTSGALLEMLYGADLVVGLSTILLLEAALASCRTLSVVPRREETEWLSGIDLGAVPSVSDRNALRAALRSALQDEPVTLPDPMKFVQPGSTERVAEILHRLISNSAPAGSLSH